MFADILVKRIKWVCTCRYAAIPVGNLGADVMLSMADFMFARTLHQGGHLLWLRDPVLPLLVPPSPDPLLDLDFKPIEVNNRYGHNPIFLSRAC